MRRTCLAQTRPRHSIDFFPAEGNLDCEENNKEDNLKAAAYGLISQKTESGGENDKKEEKGRVVELGQPAVVQLLVGKRLPQKVTTLLPSIHRASKV